MYIAGLYKPWFEYNKYHMIDFSEHSYKVLAWNLIHTCNTATSTQMDTDK